MGFDSILVANRGEIAVRVIGAARALGLGTVAVYTDADAGAPHVALADRAVRIGTGPAADSYLSVDRLLAAARETGAGAIHPGYGFLSENADFAEAVAAAGLVFVGPPAAAIRAMGDKAQARRLMQAAGVPCVPGYDGGAQDGDTLAAEAARIGYPVMVKAAAGGGGRGMRLVAVPGDLAAALDQARSEAENAFGSGALILEKAIVEPRHVEIQVFADAHGETIHLGERDCSVQRRHQKVVEEAPCPVMTPDLRADMGRAAVQAARAVDYVGAGTVEFLLDGDGGYYFLEMNTRLQVEHPVTEMVTGLDLVAMQIAVAQGDPLPLAQSDLRLDGHAIEVRLYAEDPANGFLPATGRIDLWQPPRGDGVRVDAGISGGQVVSTHYDPMLAKIVAHGATRQVALARLRRALDETVLMGVACNAGFLADLLAAPEFAEGRATTGFVGRSFGDGHRPAAPAPDEIALAAALLAQADCDAALAAAGAIPRDQLRWSSTPMLPRALTLVHGDTGIDLRIGAEPAGWRVWLDGAEIAVVLEPGEDHRLRARIGDATRAAVAMVRGDTVQLALGARRIDMRRQRAGTPDDDGGGGGRVAAPMPGLVRDMQVAPGQRVARGDTLAVLEAMKMQHRITAPVAGTVARVHVQPGQQLAAGDRMIEIEED